MKKKIKYPKTCQDKVNDFTSIRLADGVEAKSYTKNGFVFLENSRGKVIEIKMMDSKIGISHRLEDAYILKQHGRFHGALLNVLVAVSAASKIQNPNLKDREAFEAFINGTTLDRFKVEFRGELHQLSHIFYKWLRCTLVHEATVPMDIVFTKPENDSLTIRAGGTPSFVLQLSENWIDELAVIVKEKAQI